MKKTKAITQASLIAALYVALTYLANLLGLASGAIQIRFSEALTVLPLFTAAAIPGLTLGCLLANLLTGCALWDVIFGTLATLLGALGTRYLSKKSKWLAPIFPILANTLIVPFVLTYVYGLTDAMWYLFLTVAVGEVLSCGVLGIPLAGAIEKSKLFK
ncbi:MAG: QueT transporter family protein [Clostridia bacterium]|nr:QueT transporter family protein [Clostridia bacterium]